MLKFTDGVVLETAGKYRVVELRDGWYVLGQGCSIPVNTEAEGLKLVAELESL